MRETLFNGLPSTPHLVACAVKWREKNLFLQKSRSPEAELWHLPGGSVKDDESPLEAVKRIVKEKTGIAVRQIRKIGESNIRKSGTLCPVHLYAAELSSPPKSANSRYAWRTPDYLPELSPIPGEKILLNYYSTGAEIKESTRWNRDACVYLLAMKENKILMSLRKNTGYGDGKYSVVAGHIEKGESAKEAIIREAEEEAGILLKPDNLRFAHFLYHFAFGIKPHFFFTCNTWRGKPVNREPHKCGDLKFFPLNALPPNRVSFVEEVIRDVGKGIVYSEKGWHAHHAQTRRQLRAGLLKLG